MAGNLQNPFMYASEGDYTRNTRGIFYGGYTGSVTAVTNLVSVNGVVSADVTGVGSARRDFPGITYGFDRGIFRGGSGPRNSPIYGHTNLVSANGVVSADVGAENVSCSSVPS